MPVIITMPKDENVSIPSMRLNAEEGTVDIFVPVIKNAPSLSGVPQQVSVLKHYTTNLKSGEIESLIETEMSTGMIISATLVFRPEDNTVIFNDGSITVYDVETAKVRPGDQGDLIQYERLCNQDYGEATVNLGIRLNKDNIKESTVSLLTADGASEVKDAAGLALRLSKCINSNDGMFFRYAHTSTDIDGGEVHYLWCELLKAFIYVKGGVVRRMVTDYDTCIPVRNGYLLCRVTKNNKYRCAFISKGSMDKCVAKPEAEVKKFIGDYIQFTQEIVGVVNVGGENRNLFVSEEFGDLGTRLSEWAFEENGFEVIKELPKGANKEPFTSVEHDGRLTRIIFRQEA